MADMLRATGAVARWIFTRAVAAGVGVGIYFALARWIRIEQQDQIAPACFALAAVIGVIAGFLGASLFFIAGASGPTIDQIRKDHGGALNKALIGAIAGLLLSSMGAVVCGIFSNGFGAKAAMCGILMVVAIESVLVGLALVVAMRSNDEEPLPPAEPYAAPQG